MRFRIVGAFSLLMMSTAACAQSVPPVRSTPATPAPQAIPLGTGGVPGGAASEIVGEFGKVRTLRNITQATLTPVLPDPAKATGAAVIVAPGGGFVMLSIDSEGYDVARWLADQGIAAFVLKYRVKPTPVDTAEFFKSFAAAASPPQKMDEAWLKEATPDYAVEDGLAALKLVRSRAQQWGIDPKRVGMIGFSAGAITTVQVAQQSTRETMPAFIGPIYGPMIPMTVPEHAPPMFASLAFDDPIFGKTGFGLVENWLAAGKPVEVHVYQAGGHGYGLGKPGTTTTGWAEAFRQWLDANGILSARK